MASNLSLPGSDDFVMLEPNQIHDLPLRQRSSRDEAEQDHDLESPSSDDDLEHISRPGSVRSLNTPSPSSSPLLVPATVGDSTAVSSLNLQVSNAPSQYIQTSEDHRQAEHSLPTQDVSNTSTNILPCAAPPVQEDPPLPASHNHASIDQKIMDRLIEHALTTRIEQEYGHGSSKDQKLRQQMMSRFRNLPAQHSFVKGSISQLDGSKALFQGQQRSSAELEHVHRHVFTDVERRALRFLAECHTRHFKSACDFCGSFTQDGRARLHHTMGQHQEREGRRLANKIQDMVMESLEVRQPFTELFDDLQRQTWDKMNTHLRLQSHDRHIEPMTPSNMDEMGAISDWKSQIALDPENLLASMRTIFYTTIADLSSLGGDTLDHPYRSRPLAPSTAVKREPPEDDVEPNSACLSPPLKKFQPDLRERETVNSKIESTFESSVSDPRLADSPVSANAGETQPQQSGSSRHACVPQRHPEAQFDGEDDSRLHEYHVQLKLLEQQNIKRTFSCGTVPKENPPTPPKAEEHDEYSRMSAEASMDFRMEQLLENQRRIMKNMPPPLIMPDWYKVERNSKTISDHFSPQSRNALAGPEGPAREYRQDTLLAQSTQLPIPSVGDASNEKLSSLGLDLPLVNTESAHGAGGSSETKARRGYSFAPAFQPEESSKTINEWKAQMIRLEENRVGERRAAKENANSVKDHMPRMLRPCIMPKVKRNTLESADESKPNPRVTAQPFPGPPTDTQEAVPSKSCQESTDKFAMYARASNPDYQLQLMLLEQQNKFRMMRAREEDKRRKSGADGDNKGRAVNPPDRDRPVATVASEVQHAKNPDYAQQLKLLEQANKRRLTLKKEKEQKLQLEGESSSTTRPTKQDYPASVGTYGLGAVTLEEYQQRLMDRERAEILKIEVTRKQDERRRAGINRVCKNWVGGAPVPDCVPSKGSQFAFPEIIRKDDNGVSWMAFMYKKEEVKIEYTIRLDIESVDTDMLTWFFKDVNCLHESCEGWVSTAERTRQAQTAYLGRGYMSDANSVTGWSERLTLESADVLQQRLAENKVAWSLAELNPCLRADGTQTKELLQIAVKHFMGLQQSSTISRKRGTQGCHGLPEPRTNNPRAEPIKDPFVVQSADDIMHDAHLEDSSSEEDDDEDCPYPPEEPAPDSDFPTAFIDDEGIRYLTFEHYSLSTTGMGHSMSYYTVRADADSIRRFHLPRPFLYEGGILNEECICLEEWKQEHGKTSVHCNDCNVAMALGEINPILKGREKKELRCAAMTNYMHMYILRKWPSDMGDGEKRSSGDGRVLNPEVTQEDLDDAYVLFMRGPFTPDPCAQCNYCNLIVDGTGYGNRATHLARCDGFARKEEIRMD